MLFKLSPAEFCGAFFLWTYAFLIQTMKKEKKILNAIEGVLSLIDAIQDIAADHYGYNPIDLYNFTTNKKKKLTYEEACEIVRENQ